MKEAEAERDRAWEEVRRLEEENRREAAARSEREEKRMKQIEKDAKAKSCREEAKEWQ